MTVGCVEQDDWSCHGRGPDLVGGGAGQAKGSAVRHETLAEAYRDLERASGRLALIGRLAALLARTPAELLSTVCYLCQGSDRPGVRWGGLGLAERLDVRAVTTAAGGPMCGSSPGSCWRSSALS
jgi:hypothetical protein